MKKLLFTAAIILGGLTAATAQTNDVNAQKNEKEPTALSTKNAADVKVAKKIEAAQDAKLQTNTPAVIQAQDYKEVKSSEVPQAVKDAVATDFDGATISKAYLNAKGEYKIDIATADKKATTLYANAQGEWIKNDMKKQ